MLEKCSYLLKKHDWKVEKGKKGWKGSLIFVTINIRAAVTSGNSKQVLFNAEEVS